MLSRHGRITRVILDRRASIYTPILVSQVETSPAKSAHLHRDRVGGFLSSCNTYLQSASAAWANVVTCSYSIAASHRCQAGLRSRCAEVTGCRRAPASLGWTPTAALRTQRNTGSLGCPRLPRCEGRPTDARHPVVTSLRSSTRDSSRRTMPPARCPAGCNRRG
jgi:hypothetical protein